MSTKKPCPGCGKVDRLRKPDEVCRVCKSMLDRVSNIERSEARKKDGNIFVRFAERHYWNQYIHVPGEFDGGRITEIFLRLALAVSTPAFNTAWGKDDLFILGDSRSTDRYIMNKDVAEAIQDLREIIPELIDSVYAKGKGDGHNLLMRLANGDLSPNEYMKKTQEEDE